MPDTDAEVLMAQEVPFNVGVPRELKLRVAVAATMQDLTYKEFVKQALEEALKPFNDELDEFYAIGAGVVARNRQQEKNTALKAEGQR